MNVRLKYDLLFTAGVYHEGNLHMNNYALRLWMTTNSADPADQSIAFERIKYFVYSEIDSTIFVNSDDTDSCERLAQCGFNITTMPGAPVDQLVGIMLYHKLNAIAEDRMIIVETEISSTVGEGVTYLHSEYENTDTIASPAWWYTTDPTHCDTAIITSDKVVTMHQSGAWRDVDLAWADSTTDNETGNTVFFANFKSNHDTE